MTMAMIPRLITTWRSCIGWDWFGMDGHTHETDETMPIGFREEFLEAFTTGALILSVHIGSGARAQIHCYISCT